MENSAENTAIGNEWTCDGSANKVLQGYLLSGFLAIVGILFIFVLNDSSPDAVTIGYVQLLFSAIVGVLAYRGARSSDRILIINDDGIWFKTWATSVIPWNQIISIEIAGSRFNASLKITVKDTAPKGPTLKISGADLAAPLEIARQEAQAYHSRAN